MQMAGRPLDIHIGPRQLNADRMKYNLKSHKLIEGGIRDSSGHRLKDLRMHVRLTVLASQRNMRRGPGYRSNR